MDISGTTSRNPFVNQVFGFLISWMLDENVLAVGRNPFVNQVFGFEKLRRICLRRLSGRNPFVNQVFGFFLEQGKQGYLSG